jgi:hypothetical protein
MALAALVGSVALHSASADTMTSPQAQPAAQATAAPAAPATTPGNKQGRPNGGFRGGLGMGHPGMGGPGMGRPGMGGPGMGGPAMGRRGGATTAEGANRVISATNNLITLVKNDLTYATGKMDTTTAADWVSRAEGLVKSAQSAVTASEFGKAVATTNAAGNLAQAADLLMQQALGADKLPSYNQRGFPGRVRPNVPNATPATPTQAQSSREMASFYNEITRTSAELKAATSAGDAATYLTGAQNRYSTAYTAYQAGNYGEAHNSVAVGRLLLAAAQNLLRATTAPNSPDTPVQVPAPNF